MNIESINKILTDQYINCKRQRLCYQSRGDYSLSSCFYSSMLTCIELFVTFNHCTSYFARTYLDKAYEMYESSLKGVFDNG